jgi:hypothetical protein
MGFSTGLYGRNLLFIDSVDLPSSQWIYFTLCLNFFFFFLDVLCPCQSSVEMHAQVFHFRTGLVAYLYVECNRCVQNFELNIVQIF